MSICFRESSQTSVSRRYFYSRNHQYRRAYRDISPLNFRCFLSMLVHQAIGSDYSSQVPAFVPEAVSAAHCCAPYPNPLSLKLDLQELLLTRSSLLKVGQTIAIQVVLSNPFSTNHILFPLLPFLFQFLSTCMYM